MFGQCLVAIGCLFLTISGAPLINKTETQPTVPKNDTALADLLLPESFQAEKNYELLGGGFEGDMLFPKGFHPARAGQARGVAAAGPRLWPDNTIPYDLSYISSGSHQNFIVQAMQNLMFSVATTIPGQGSRAPCVLFRPRTAADRYFVRITYGDGCSGTVGYSPGTDMVMTLANPGCFTTGIIQHELLHVLGFYHEQSRPDRDSYVVVYPENIQSGKGDNFDKYTWGREVLNQNSPYDYQSIMHYDAYAFSFNGRPTILPRRSGVSIGQRRQLSPIDVAEVRAYYQC